MSIGACKINKSSKGRICRIDSRYLVHFIENITVSGYNRIKYACLHMQVPFLGKDEKV